MHVDLDVGAGFPGSPSPAPPPSLHHHGGRPRPLRRPRRGARAARGRRPATVTDARLSTSSTSSVSGEGTSRATPIDTWPPPEIRLRRPGRATPDLHPDPLPDAGEPTRRGWWRTPSNCTPPTPRDRGAARWSPGPASGDLDTGRRRRRGPAWRRRRSSTRTPPAPERRRVRFSRTPGGVDAGCAAQLDGRGCSTEPMRMEPAPEERITVSPATSATVQELQRNPGDSRSTNGRSPPLHGAVGPDVHGPGRMDHHVRASPLSPTSPMPRTRIRPTRARCRCSRGCGESRSPSMIVRSPSVRTVSGNWALEGDGPPP